MNFENLQKQAAAGMVATQLGGAGQQAINRAAETAAPPTPCTLLRALAEVERLNVRLGGLAEHIQQIAVAIGGPWPCDAAAGGALQGAPASTQPPAMVVLNAGLDAVHVRVSSIEDSIAAIRRSLGA